LCQGNVLYEAYASTKKQGQSAGSTLKGTSDQLQREVKQARDKIDQALKNNFKSLQQAFKRMDADRDGRLSRDEFRKGVEQRLKLRLPSRLLEEVIRTDLEQHLRRRLAETRGAHRSLPDLPPPRKSPGRSAGRGLQCSSACPRSAIR
jgi:hypothetical protein